ncbi:MAG: hypothetical protein KAS32_03265 [Candidatus Peribacteraceae bacterium]|nr:hypothetical protein [Candidatus Peribacteraceae bacterium]
MVRLSKSQQSKIGKKSRRKGKAFECKMARHFTEWTGMEWSSTRNSGRTDLKGDIYCVRNPEISLIIECKDRKSYSVHAMVKPTKAFFDMELENIKKLYASDMDALMFIVKNDTGIWISIRQRTAGNKITCVAREGCDTIRAHGNNWILLKDLESISVGDWFLGSENG